MATGVVGMMTQMALEQAIQKITDYLKSIDEKVGELFKTRRTRPWPTSSGWSLKWTRPWQSGTRRAH